VFFLIAAIAFGLGFIVYADAALKATPRTITLWAPVLVAAGLCLVAIAWLVL